MARGGDAGKRRSATPGARVLIIDDDADIADSLSDLLSDAGYGVTAAADGAGALRLLAVDPLPDVILLDLAMPGMHGLSFLAIQRQRAELAGIATFVMTAGGIAQELKDLEVTGWLRKPLDGDSLLAVLGRHSSGGQPAPGPHLAHFYVDESDLMERLSAFAHEGLRCGEPTVLIATIEHARELRRALLRAGCDAREHEQRGALTIIDAGETLAAIQRGGQLERSRFTELVTQVIDRAHQVGGGRPVRVFGEVVDLLWRQGDVAGAVRLENFWNDFMRTRPLSLLCAYRMNAAQLASNTGALFCAAHAGQGL